MRGDRVIVGLVAVIALLAGCSSTAQFQQVQQLVLALRSLGATVQVATRVNPRFLDDRIPQPVETRILQVNGEDVQVFRFPTAAVAADAADRVAPDGYAGTDEGGFRIVEVTWASTPHFYRSGSLIVLYVGDDSATQRLLSEVVGSQFAGR